MGLSFLLPSLFGSPSGLLFFGFIRFSQLPCIYFSVASLESSTQTDLSKRIYCFILVNNLGCSSFRHCMIQAASNATVSLSPLLPLPFLIRASVQLSGRLTPHTNMTAPRISQYYTLLGLFSVANVRPFYRIFQ